MRYRKVTLMPPQGLVLERIARLWHGWVQHCAWEDILYIYLVIRLFAYQVSKQLAPQFLTLTCLVFARPSNGICGRNLWIQFYGDIRSCWVLGSGDQTDYRSHHTSSSRDNLQQKFSGKPLIQVWGNLIFPSWLKEWGKMWIRGKRNC